MNNASPALFLSIVLGVYIAVNATLVVNLAIALRNTGALRIVSVLLLTALALAFPAGRILHARAPGLAADIVVEIGSLYIAPMIYAFLIAIVIDAIVLSNKVFAILPRATGYMDWSGGGLCAMVAILAIGISVGGWVNALRAPVVREAEISLSDGVGGELNIVAVSDIHVGRKKDLRRLEKVIESIKRAAPQAVLFLGDTIDDMDGGDPERASAILRTLDPPLGKWAVLGNHEYYAGLEKSRKILEDGGVNLLVDGYAALGGRVLLVGRDDPAGARFGIARKSLDEILSARSESERALPILLMDHQPIDLAAAERNGVLLQLSGHTHNGQLFPFNFIVSRLFENSYGPYKRGRTNYWVSSGAGTWGPPVRTSGSPEILSITLQ